MKRICARAGLVLALLLVAAGPRPAAAAGRWIENVRTAMVLAAKQKKDVLLEFTGSDWCPYCVKLNDEVFTKVPFITEAPKKFVLVKLDFPRNTKLPARLEQQNRQLKEKLNVTGFPTVFLVDAKGMPYAKTGYFPGGSAKYMRHLNDLQKRRINRDKYLAQAAKARGLAKAKLLDRAMSSMDKATGTAFYSKIIREIIRLDAKNEAGLKTKYAGQQILAQVLQKVNAALRRRNTKNAMKAIDDAIKELKPSGTVGQELYFMKADVLYRSRDKSGAKAALETAYQMAPLTDRASEIQETLKRSFKDVN